MEQNQKTNKRLAGRSGRSIESMMFWCNDSPNNQGLAPTAELYEYTVNLPNVARLKGTSRVDIMGILIIQATYYM